jgi:hypothetical protein
VVPHRGCAWKCWKHKKRPVKDRRMWYRLCVLLLLLLRLLLQVLSDSNTDFLVVGVCSSELALAPALVAALAGKPAAAVAGNSQQLPGLQMHVSYFYGGGGGKCTAATAVVFQSGGRG